MEPYYGEDFGEILDHRFPLDKRKRRNIEYHVKWKEYSNGMPTWETAEKLRGCREIVDKYHHRYPAVPHPYKLPGNQIEGEDEYELNQ